MTYTVTTTCGHDANGRPVPIPMTNHRDLRQALADASDLISRGCVGVVIRDQHGNSIDGSDLIACCNGEKRLTADLHAEHDG